LLVEPFGPDLLKAKIDAIFSTQEQSARKVQKEVFDKASQLQEKGKLDEALQVYSNILDGQEDAEVYYNIGYIKVAQGKYDEALVAFRRALMIDNVHGHAYKKMGEVYTQMGEAEEAENCYEKAGNIFMEREMEQEAEISFKEVLKINPDTVNVYNSLGILYRRQKRYKDAVDSYHRALKVTPDDETIYYNLGHAYLEDMQVDEARKALQKALELNKEFEKAKKLLKGIEEKLKLAGH